MKISHIMVEFHGDCLGSRVIDANQQYVQPGTSRRLPRGPSHRPVSFASEAGQLPPSCVAAHRAIAPKNASRCAERSRSVARGHALWVTTTRRQGRGKRWLLLRRWKTVRGSKRAELQTLFAANRRLFKAYVLCEQLDRLWTYKPATLPAIA